MNARIVLIALLVAGIPVVAIAAAQDAPEPEDPGAPGTPSLEGQEDVAFDEVFVHLQRNECPIADGFQPETLKGSTGWHEAQHPFAPDECIAQWGDDTYDRGSKASLSSSDTPTRHLPPSNPATPVINDAAQALLEENMDLRVAGPIITGLADGCAGVDSFLFLALSEAGVELCRAMIGSSTILLDLPEAPAGGGNLYFELGHAYAFSDPDENRIAADGAWVEVRKPGEPFKRIDPVALYGPSDEGLGTLCHGSGPMMLALSTLLRTDYNLPFVLGTIGSVEDEYTWTEGFAGEQAGNETTDQVPNLFSPIPESISQWREDCGSIVQAMYGDSVDTRDEAQDTERQAPGSTDAYTLGTAGDRFTPYPGTVRGEGSGFVGSTEDASGRPQFVDNWFDLSPYAGETVEVRLVATGGAGIGTQQGGWWIDHANLRYASLPDDLSVRVDTPRDGDVLPSGLSDITPGGTLPVDVVVENLGRTTSQEATVEVQLDGASTIATVPALEPLESHRVTANLPIPTSGSHEITAELVHRFDADEEAQSAPYGDGYQPNNDDAVNVEFDTVHDLTLDVTNVEREGSMVNLTVQAENHGNEPFSTLLEATLTPVDVSTRNPRAIEAQPLDPLGVVTVPHSQDVNAFGVMNPTVTTSTTFELPSEGVWQATVTSPLHPGAQASAVVPLGEATPTAITSALGSIVEGPTETVPRGGYELVGILGDDDEPAAFTEDTRHPITGPETRWVPSGETAIATSGQELPWEWSPLERDNPASGASAEIGPDPLRGCGVDAEAGIDDPFLDQFLDQPIVEQNVVDPIKDALCRLEDRAGLDPTGGEVAGELEAETMDDLRLPASMQTWHLRQNHVNIYGVGTVAADTGPGGSATALNDLRVTEEDERVYLTFDHAASVDWANERGAKAELLVVPGGETDLIEEMQNAEDQTRALIEELGEQGLPPEGQALLYTVLMDLVFENVIGNTPDTRIPQGICQGVPQPVGIITETLMALCGDAQVLELIESNTEEDVDFTDHAESTYLHQNAKARDEGLSLTWEDPTGWENQRIDITDIVEATTRDDGVDEGFYVMFNLVTTSDVDEVLTSASIDAPGRGDEIRAENEGGTPGGASADATFGWERGEVPLWTVNDPSLEKVMEDEDEPRAEWCLSAVRDDSVASCPSERTLKPADMRGWAPFPLDAAVEPSWSYEQRGGDPSSQAPGALVWEGGTGEIVHTSEGPRIAIDQATPDAYGVLESPVVDLSGYDVPVVEMNVEWGQTEAGDIEPPENINDERYNGVEDRCTSAEDEGEASEVWTWTGWNVRVTPINPDGSLGETQTVDPFGGYDDCHEDLDVPILFDGQAIHRAPTYGASGQADSTDGLANPQFPGSNAGNCEPGTNELTDPLQACRPTEVAFGHGEPVFALPTTGWNEVAFDLSAFQGQTVQIEVHAFGVNNDDGEGRGELRIDAFEVAEGEPPFDVRSLHDDRSFIAPDTEERFRLEVQNRGAERVDQIEVRRTVLGPDGCQAVDPVVEPWLLIDPATGEPGLPPGESATIRNPQLAWEVPGDTGEVYQRLLTVGTTSVEPSIAPDVLVGSETDGTVEALVVDEDDCTDDIEITVNELRGRADTDTDGAKVTVAHEDAESVETRSSVKIQGHDAHGVEGLPAYVTPLPPTLKMAKFTAECDGLECTFDASESQGLSSDIETYAWDFGGSGTCGNDDCDEQEVATFEYEEEGTYEVQLAVTDEDGFQDFTTRTIDVTEDPGQSGGIQDDLQGVGQQLNQVRDTVFTPTEDEDIEDVLRNGSAQVEVLQSAMDEHGTGSTVEIAIDTPDPRIFTQLILPCETGDLCEGNLVEETRAENILLNDLSPGHYLGYVMFGERIGFAPIEFTVPLEPEPGTDARTGDNTVTLRSEIREDPSVSVSSIDVPKMLPVGEEITFDILVHNDGNVPLNDVTTSITVEPLGLTLQADTLPRLDRDETRATTATFKLPSPGPGTVLVDVEADDEQGKTVDDVRGSGIIVVDRHEVSAGPGDHADWDTGDAIQLGDGNRVPANVNSVLPLTGMMDTASSPFSLLEVNVSGQLERAYDGISIEWRPADATMDDRGHLVDEEPLVTDGYRIPGQNLEILLHDDASPEIQDRVEAECNPLIDTSEVRDQSILVRDLSDQTTYDCRNLPLDTQITSSHEGGTPGQMHPALTGEPTLGVPGVDTQQIRAAASDLPGTERRLVDTVTSEDWMQFGSFTLDADSSFLDKNHAFYMPTGTLVGSGQQYTHQLRVPLTVGEWCQLTEEMVPERTPFRIHTEERRLFSEDWDLNIRFESGPLDTMSPRFVTGEPIITMEDETTTGWMNLEYDIPLGPLDPLTTADEFPGKLTTDSDSCDALENEVPDLDTPPLRAQEHRFSDAHVVFELTTTRGADEDALEVGWFLGSIEIPELGIDLGAETSNHIAEACDTNVKIWPTTVNSATTPLTERWEDPDHRAVLGCSSEEKSTGSKTGTFQPPDEGGDDEPAFDPDQTVQVIDLSNSTLPYADYSPVPMLVSLLDERPFTVEDDALRAHPSDYGHEGEDWFRYVDAVALVDLRAGLDGEIRFDLDTDEGDTVVAQLVATPVQPGEASSEEAPSRVDWTPLELCEQDSVSITYPPAPLGAEPGSLVGPVTPDRFTTMLDMSRDGLDALCADVGPVGGEIALVGVRLWMPDPTASVEIGEGSVFMDVPQPQQLLPQLRAMTDNTVHEGTMTIHDASILSMPPAFSHQARVAFDDPITWGGSDIVASNSTPTLAIEVAQPGLESDWDIEANLSIDVVASGAATDVQTGTYAGEIDLPASTYEGSQTIHIPWETLRESIEWYEDGDDEGGHEDPNKPNWIDWLEDHPVLPSGDIEIRSMSVDVNTTPNRLIDSPLPRCPTSLDGLDESKDLGCRQLASIIQDGRDATTSILTENAFRGAAGATDLSIEPDRAPAGTPRTATIDIANPSSFPVELGGTLTLAPPHSANDYTSTFEDHDGAPFAEVDVPDTLLDPWGTATVTVEIPRLEDETERVVVEATIGDATVQEDYRTTTRHESFDLFPRFFDLEDNGVERTGEAAKPDLPGHTSDTVGWRLEANGGARTITHLATNGIGVEQLERVLAEGEDPLFVFDHQRSLRGDAGPSAPDGDYSYLAVAMCPGDPSQNAPEEQEQPCTLLEDAWAPEGSSEIAYYPQSDQENNEWNGCTNENVNQVGEELMAHGIEDGSRVIAGSTGPIREDVLPAWETAAFSFTQDDIESATLRNPPNSDYSEVHFRILLGQCSVDNRHSEVIVDNVELGSARPVLEIGADDVPIWPGSEKQYRFTLSNHGAGSDTVHIVPAADLPTDWHVSITLEDATVYDSRTETLEPVELPQGATLEGTARVQAPGTAQGSSLTIPLTAYAVDAPGLASSGALSASAGGPSDDPGQLVIEPQRVDLPDLQVNEDAITVEDAEIGREANIQIQIKNEGFQRAEDVPIAVTVRGPSGFEPLQTPGGEHPVYKDLDPGATTTLTYTWNPREPGEHTLRVVADPDPEDVALLLDDDVERFFGLVQERQECATQAACPNLADHAFTVHPLQQPDLRLTVDGVPDRISLGDATRLTVTVENIGGRAATDATLRLSENGLLPIFDTMTVDLPRIEPGDQAVLTTTWEPVSPGEGLVLGTATGPDVYAGQRPDGTSAGHDSEVAIPVTIDRAGVDMTLSEPIRTEPGTAHAVLATITNDGTAPLTVNPETSSEGGIFLSPVLNAPITVAPGENTTLPMLGFAEIGTPPGSKDLPVSLSQGTAHATVNVLGHTDARIHLDTAPLDPGTTQRQAHVTNLGNVPLDGELRVRGPGIHGAASIHIAPGEGQNVTVPVMVEPGAEPGTTVVATHVTTDEGDRVTQHARLPVESAPVLDFTLNADEVPLTGSAHGELLIRNVGNEPLNGRAALDGPVSLNGAPRVDLDPGETQALSVTWIAGTDRTGNVTVETLDGEPVGSASLAPGELAPSLQITRVETQPSVNLVEGMRVEVVGTIENTGDTTLRNHTLGLTLDGELYQTFLVDDVRPGEATIASHAIELPRGGEITLGMVDLAAFQRGETAGAATTIQADEATLGLSTMLEVPTLPIGSVLAVLAAAAGVKRR